MGRIPPSQLVGSVERSGLAVVDEAEAEQSMHRIPNSANDENPSSSENVTKSGGGLASMFEATAAEQEQKKRRNRRF